MSKAEICITPEQFDENNLIIEDPQTSSFKKGTASISMTSSKIYYLDENGTKCELYVMLPTQRCFGLSYQATEYGQQGTKDNAKGLQFTYNMRSLESGSSPTEEEQNTMNMLVTIRNMIIEKCKEELEEAKKTLAKSKKTKGKKEIPTRIPGTSISSIRSVLGEIKEAENEDDIDGIWDNAIKPLWTYSKDKETEDINFDQPRMYIPLLTSGNGRTLKMLTKIHGPGDVDMHQERLVSAKGEIKLFDTTPVVHLKSLFWGGHGKKPYGVSLKVILVEANVVPGGNSNLPSRRMLPQNSAAAERAEPNATKEELEEQDNDFQSESVSEEITKQIKKKVPPKKKPVTKKRPAVQFDDDE